MKIFTKVLVILLVVVTAVLLVRAVFNYAMGKKLENYLAEAKAEGIPLALKDIAPSCPDPDNAAPLWKAAEALFILPDEKDRKLAFDTVGAFFDGKPFDEAARQTLARLCGKNRRVFELIAEAAARPCLRFGDWTKAPWAIEQVKAMKTIQATRLLGIDAVLQADAGQVREGLEECRNGMHFVRKLMDEPWLLNNLVALSEMKVLLICFDRIARGRGIDSATLAAWMNEMNFDFWRHQSVRWIPTERLIGLEWGLKVIGGKPGDASAALSLLGDEKGIDRFFYWLVRPVLKSQFIWVHKRYGDLEKIAPEPYYKQNEFLNKRNLERVPWYYRPTGVLFADFRGVFLKEAALEAMMLTTKAGLACKIYKNKTGRYPESLGALVPDLLPEVPIDPFTGKPLIYKIQSGELLIYSLGSNQKDDGGRMTYQITKLIMDKDDDWTWREKINP
jgi:hypothetical protein